MPFPLLKGRQSPKFQKSVKTGLKLSLIEKLTSWPKPPLNTGALLWKKYGIYSPQNHS